MMLNSQSTVCFEKCALCIIVVNVYILTAFPVDDGTFNVYVFKNLLIYVTGFSPLYCMGEWTKCHRPLFFNSDGSLRLIIEEPGVVLTAVYSDGPLYLYTAVM